MYSVKVYQKCTKSVLKVYQKCTKLYCTWYTFIMVSKNHILSFIYCREGQLNRQ
jgi:hypothetical protein